MDNNLIKKFTGIISSKCNFINNLDIVFINCSSINMNNLRDFIKKIYYIKEYMIILYGSNIMIDNIIPCFGTCCILGNFNDLCIMYKYRYIIDSPILRPKSCKFLNNYLFLFTYNSQQYYLLTKKEIKCDSYITNKECKSQTNLIIFDIDNIDFKELTKLKSLKNLSIIGR